MIVWSSSVMAARGALAIGRRPIITARLPCGRLSCPSARLPAQHSSHPRAVMFNRTTAWILIAALAAGLGLWAGQRWFATRTPVGPQLQAVKLFDHPRELPPFSLQQSDGTQLVPGELKGHWTL